MSYPEELYPAAEVEDPGHAFQHGPSRKLLHERLYTISQPSGARALLEESSNSPSGHIEGAYSHLSRSPQGAILVSHAEDAGAASMGPSIVQDDTTGSPLTTCQYTPVLHNGPPDGVKIEILSGPTELRCHGARETCALIPEATIDQMTGTAFHRLCDSIGYSEAPFTCSETTTAQGPTPGNLLYDSLIALDCGSLSASTEIPDAIDLAETTSLVLIDQDTANSLTLETLNVALAQSTDTVAQATNTANQPKDLSRIVDDAQSIIGAPPSPLQTIPELFAPDDVLCHTETLEDLANRLSGNDKALLPILRSRTPSPATSDSLSITDHKPETGMIEATPVADALTPHEGALVNTYATDIATTASVSSSLLYTMSECKDAVDLSSVQPDISVHGTSMEPTLETTKVIQPNMNKPESSSQDRTQVGSPAVEVQSPNSINSDQPPADPPLTDTRTKVALTGDRDLATVESTLSGGLQEQYSESVPVEAVNTNYAVSEHLWLVVEAIPVQTSGDVVGHPAPSICHQSDASSSFCESRLEEPTAHDDQRGPNMLDQDEPMITEDIEEQATPPEATESLDLATSPCATSTAWVLPLSSPPRSSSPFPSSSQDMLFTSSPPREMGVMTPPSSPPPAPWCRSDENEEGNAAIEPEHPKKRALEVKLNAETEAEQERTGKRMKTNDTSAIYVSPHPKRATAKFQEKQKQKLKAPFRSPLLNTGTVLYGVNAVYASGKARPKPTMAVDFGSRSAHPPPTSNSNTAEASSIATSKDYTDNAAKQFKSPLATDGNSGVNHAESAFSGVKAAPTIQALQGKVQILKQAIKIKKDGGGGDEDELEALAKNWRDVAREVAWAVWDTVKDFDPGESVAPAKTRWMDDEYGASKGQGNKSGGFDGGWGWDDARSGKVKYEGSDKSWGWNNRGKAEEVMDTKMEGRECDLDESQDPQHTLGTMLRHLGIAPETLGWDDDEGDFVDID
ncbi:hypothetical protein OBBRIDRAFT_885381 [Obba rivulosa]|uniref:Uncharacterized protein n=1 Tax=Obba rivulosa TaxID=1052685 RepID=A0A8E2J2W7_9APHY|nr:hypothetical protein OBBRIDRAFT_885381 [Obba rivulosa]